MADIYAGRKQVLLRQVRKELAHADLFIKYPNELDSRISYATGLYAQLLGLDVQPYVLGMDPEQ